MVKTDKNTDKKMERAIRMVRSSSGKLKRIRDDDDDNEDESGSENKYDSESSDDEDDDDFISDDSDDDGDMNKAEFNAFLSKIFPSKYIQQKAQTLKDEKSRKYKNTKNTKNTKNKNSNKQDKNTRQRSKRGKQRKQELIIIPIVSKSRKRSHEDSEEDFEVDEDSDSQYEYEDSDEEDIGEEDSYDEDSDDEGSDDEDSDDEDSEHDDSDDEDSDDEDCEDEECEDHDNDDVDIDEDKLRNSKSKKTKKNASSNKPKEKKNHDDYKKELALKKETLDKMKLAMAGQSGQESNEITKNADKFIRSEMKRINKQLQKYERKKKKKAQTKFRSLLKGKMSTTDIEYFKKLPYIEQSKLLIEMDTINSSITIDKPYRISILELDIPASFKACAMKKVNMLRYMEPGAGEYYKVKNWIDTFMKIPFGKNSNLPIKFEDGVDKCHDFMESAKASLDAVVYGLEDAKMQIMQLIGQLITNPQAIGTAIAIHGPMGTGKTTLVKDGISKILGREFAFIALGGATDSSFLEGHSYTYEGSMWGQIVDILIRCKTMNPIIYFDELDKVSDSAKGEEIIGILTHLTDTTQNSEFHDKFFSEIKFDLSKCLFIFSYNDESKVNPILKDRMYRIQTAGYNVKDKNIICSKHLMPKICEQVKFKEDEIIIKDDVVEYIVTNHTNEEKGIRTLKRCLEIIHTKLNLYRLMKPNTKLFENELTLDVTFPFEVTKDVVDTMIKKSTSGSNISVLRAMYI
uniref:ATPase AAA-type core domain-containing protein n=1 Tax=viral metagenome TaxID=1070528 RepID=A0A6C0JCX9_9ZZZZ